MYFMIQYKRIKFVLLRGIMKAGKLKIIIIACAVCVLIIKYLICDYFIVSGDSMKDSYFDNDVVFVSKVFDSLNRFDVVICKSEEPGSRSIIIKRVIGLPSETVQIIDGCVFINEKKLNDFVNVKINNAGIASEPLALGEDQYFLLGDNRNNSEDSRSEWLGIVDLKQIEGKVVFKILEAPHGEEK